MLKKTIIVGHNGQDGSLLVEDLKKRGDEIIGIGRFGCTFPNGSSLDFSCDITDSKDVSELIKFFQPNEIYYLAAHHASSEGRAGDNTLGEEFYDYQKVNVTGLVNILSGVVDSALITKTFYASSSLIFSGLKNDGLQNESTFLMPEEFYGLTKAQGMQVCKYFREKYQLFVATGILYNHESHFRPANFFTSKVIKAAIRISQGAPEKLYVGNLSALTDWGYAKDYVVAFQKILAYDKAEDFIVATGELHSASEFIEIVFDFFGLDSQKYIVENKAILTRTSHVRVGDSTKLTDLTGWKPSLSFKNFVIQLIVDHQNAGA